MESNASLLDSRIAALHRDDDGTTVPTLATSGGYGNGSGGGRAVGVAAGLVVGVRVGVAVA